ncbi:uncharacterized protein EV420DRAFT_452261 [Desarmillaria tabescens]|uniref:Uncharacterized protein n=1 Tax=Armillaria tabescens TaxID=1929756 RepID=A0AA39NM65_ARMTA|nr:uncharacterized protein EV420DRAFT_452261 [Desarmillaria tabescens]KAK0468217.1 hypothetical protein EV420DRAFT_452261 [Desarmillaria tabescens]
MTKSIVVVVINATAVTAALEISTDLIINEAVHTSATPLGFQSYLQLAKGVRVGDVADTRARRAKMTSDGSCRYLTKSIQRNVDSCT